MKLETRRDTHPQETQDNLCNGQSPQEVTLQRADMLLLCRRAIDQAIDAETGQARPPRGRKGRQAPAEQQREMPSWLDPQGDGYAWVPGTPGNSNAALSAGVEIGVGAGILFLLGLQEDVVRSITVRGGWVGGRQRMDVCSYSGCIALVGPDRDDRGQGEFSGSPAVVIDRGLRGEEVVTQLKRRRVGCDVMLMLIPRISWRDG